MAQDKGLTRVYTELPSWAKGVVVVGGLVVGYVAVTSIIGAIKGAINKGKSEQEVNTAKDELQQQINNGNKPTIARSTAEAISSGIVEAANDCDVTGNGARTIISKFDNIQNQADMLLLVDVFGLRKKVRCPFTSDTRESFWSKYTTPISLSAILGSELSQGQIDTINKNLASKGIKYKF